MSAKGWVFTLNNYSEEEYEYLLNYDCDYVIIGKEVGEQGTPHLQGYIEFHKRMRLTGVKKVNGKAHWEVRRGSALLAANYCKKENNWADKGVMGGQGIRTDLDNVRLLALEEGMRGVTMHGSFQQIKVAEKFLTYHEEPRDWKPEVIWIYGETGSGKSKTAREICTGDVFTKSEGSKWWDGYDGHEEVIIDDFRSSWWCLTYMLRLLDRYECQVEIKGGLRQFKPKKIVVTSIYKPEECYIGVGEDINQLLRRIDKCTDVPKSEGNTENFLLD